LLGERLNAKILNWPVEYDLLSQIDILINCSILGSLSKVEINGTTLSFEEYTPLTRDSNKDKIVPALSKIKSNALVFDIIYDPDPTKLLKLSAELGLRTLNGKKMNIQQAVLAFEYAVPEATDRNLIHKSMIEALN
jgi:shikimate 5-dehydrogenase